MRREKVLGVLPARLGSTRMKRKMLAQIAGKPLIYYTWKQAKKARTLDAVIVATDSDEIRKVAESFGAEVVMTAKSIRSGSDRVATAARLYKKFHPTIVVNIQGDEPLIPPSAIDDCVRVLLRDTSILVSTPATAFRSERDVSNPSFVKVVCDQKGNALYFSRSMIPFPRIPYKKYWKHMGLYAFHAPFLEKYVSLSETPLEKVEKLEQLRILEHGYSIRVVCGVYPNMEVNTPAEFAYVKAHIEKQRRN